MIHVIMIEMNLVEAGICENIIKQAFCLAFKEILYTLQCLTEVKLVSENQSVYIPLGAVHRLENEGKLPMTLIEVQTGTYLGEDDIVRYEDVYGRAPEEVEDMRDADSRSSQATAH